jgi:acetyl esterase/lipase
LSIVRDVEYARRDGRSLRLDVYHMQPSATPRPLVVWIHGGTSATARIATPAAAFVSATGFAVASVDYRTGSGVTTAMQLADAKAAVRWLRANAGRFGIDPAQIGAMGFDAGGRLATLLGTTADVAALDAAEPGAPASARVQAVVTLAAPMTTNGPNPVTFVTEDDAPTLIVHGTADETVSTRQSQMLVSALKVAGVATTLDMPVGVGHDLGALLSPIAMQTVRNFLSQHLLGERTTTGLSSFVATPAHTYIDPVALDLGGTKYGLYPTPVRGAGTYASYRVYVPPDYETDARRRYPVIYFLHGRSVDSKRPITSGYVARIDAAIRSGVMPPTVVVLVQGLNTGWYVDSEDGQHPIESVIVNDLIRHVDATYRTIAAREARAIEGHSMGGFGALHIGLKYPDLFSSVTGNSPAMIENVPDGMGSQAYWDREWPATVARANLETVRRQRLRVIIGDQDSLFAGAKRFSEALTALNVPHEFIPVPESPHNHDQLLQYEAFDTMEFYGEAFAGVQ